MQLLGGQEREALGQVEPHLAAEDAERTGARAVAALHPVCQDIGEQVEVLPLRMVRGSGVGSGDGDMGVHRASSLGDSGAAEQRHGLPHPQAA